MLVCNGLRRSRVLQPYDYAVLLREVKRIVSWRVRFAVNNMKKAVDDFCGTAVITISASGKGAMGGWSLSFCMRST